MLQSQTQCDLKSQPNHLKQVTSAVLQHSTSAPLQHLPVDTAAAPPPCPVLTHNLQLHSAAYSPSRQHLGLAVNTGLDLSVTNQANQLLLQSTAALSNSSSSSSSSNSRSSAAHAELEQTSCSRLAHMPQNVQRLDMNADMPNHPKHAQSKRQAAERLTVYCGVQGSPCPCLTSHWC